MNLKAPPESYFYFQIGLRIKDHYEIINAADIVYVEASGNNAIVYLANRPAGIVLTSSFRGLLQALPADKFCQIHRSYLVCKIYIRRINIAKTRVFYDDDKTLPVSEGCLSNLLEQLPLFR